MKLDRLHQVGRPRPGLRTHGRMTTTHPARGTTGQTTQIGDRDHG